MLSAQLIFPALQLSLPLMETLEDVVVMLSSISSLINRHSDSLEKLLSSNAMKIEGLKKTVEFVSSEVKDVKVKVDHLTSWLRLGEQRIETCETRLADLERYSRCWNLRLRGVPEKEKENIRDEVIRICEQTYPDGKFSFAIDSVHRLGKKQNQIGSKPVPCAVIVLFTSHIIRDAVWKAAKSSAYLKDNGLRFREDLTPLDRERQKKLWLMVEEACTAGKAAYYVGAHTFINGIEIFCPRMLKNKKKN
ncbi:LINE-1 retrotransposable element ORF1 protein [Labeo rohita]|uniref:LINE-1 retrotransposable element ORF1 protein n=1 Tax=Labeo rohita TaxID=84645 RepID=A0ABQ8L5Y5_LABRO|nr:LINE-1 retrotransposable element ORF1 protein [Labeo rohita]